MTSLARGWVKCRDQFQPCSSELHERVDPRVMLTSAVTLAFTNLPYDSSNERGLLLVHQALAVCLFVKVLIS